MSATDQARALADGQTLLDASSKIRTVSDDGTAAVGTVAFQDDLYSLPAEMKESVASLLDDADIDGVQIDYSSTSATSIDGIVGPGEVVGVVIAAIVLLVMLRALLPAVAPLITSLVGVGVGVAGSMAFSGVVDMASITPVLGVMLGLAVGIDYALFILNRHRRQLLAGVELSESIGLANGTSGNAVVFAGTTVIVALLALNVTGIPFLGVMGTVGAVCVAVAVLVAVTLTPALLGLMKLRVLGRRARARIGHPDHAATTPAPMRTWRAVGQAAIAIVALLVIAIPALSMRLGLPDGSSEATDTTQYRANTIITEKFGAGVNGALLVVAEFPVGGRRGRPDLDPGRHRHHVDGPERRRRGGAGRRLRRRIPLRVPGRAGGRPLQSLHGAARARAAPPSPRFPATCGSESPARHPATSTCRRSSRTRCRSTCWSWWACRW